MSTARLASTLALASLLLGPAVRAQDAEPVADERPVIDVAFVLDTTGSMGGLIDGAKKKIWSIVNTLLTGVPLPEVRVALVGYRDQGDDYVTRRHDFSDNIDEIFGQLQAFEAGGGGDHPEYVEKALAEAIDDLSWKEGRALRIIFLVGDAPPHEYEDGLDLPTLCEKAVRKEIIINTVRCGGDSKTEEVWQDIARRSEGSYLSIDQSGGMTAVATPFDAAIGDANDRLVETRLIYGSAEYQEAATYRLALQKGLDADAKAGCATWNSFNGRIDRQDLLDACAAAESIDETLAAIDEKSLPPELRELPAAERKARIEELLARRKVVQEELAELASKREAFLEQKLAELEGEGDSFDQGVLETLKRQAVELGVTYK